MQPGDVGSPCGASEDFEAVVSDRGEVELAVLADLKALPKEFRGSSVAAAALAMAREIDDPGNSATSKSMCAARLIEAMERLSVLVPEKPKESKLDEIGKRREQRLARRSVS